MTKNINKQAEEKFEKEAKVIKREDVGNFVEDRYLPFSWSVCLDRALVYSQDGLKPIQRRILWTAYKLGLTDKSPKMKSATFEGRVMKYSPHGGSYGSIVNMAAPEVKGQPRAIRLPLGKGKGNWGGIDLTRNQPGAARYTELSLFPAAMELIKELGENTVTLVSNYDNTDVEPVYLPARWPVALINGVPDAMAVGFACNLPSHNPDEVMEAAIALLKNPDMSISDITKIIAGPDFQCGCDIISTTVRDGKSVDGIKQYMNTGSGSFVMKATYEMHEDNGSYVINFKHLPYKVAPEKVVEELKKHYENGEFKELSYWNDMSDINEPVNLEVRTKKNINISKVLNDLFQKTSLQSTFAANNTIIIDQTPVQSNIKTILEEFIKFRKQCTTNKLNYRLDDKKHKLRIQKAISAVLVDIDKCISIIRNSDDEKSAKEELTKAFKIDDEQAGYILSMQLRKLTKTDSLQVDKLIKSLSEEVKDIESILNNEDKFIEFISSEMEDTKKNISSPRLCKIMKAEEKPEDSNKDVFLLQKDGKIARTFKKQDDATKVNKDGKILVITESKAFIRSIYELADEKFSAISKLKFPGKGLTVAAGEGYLLVVGEGGSAKLVDMSGVNYPKKDCIDEIFKQKIVFAAVTKDLDHKLVINDSVSIDLSEVPIQSIYAKGGRKFTRQIVEKAEIA